MATLESSLGSHIKKPKAKCVLALGLGSALPIRFSSWLISLGLWAAYKALKFAIDYIAYVC